PREAGLSPASGKRDIGKVAPQCQEKTGHRRAEIWQLDFQPLGFMRQSWKPSVEIDCSMVLRENLCGGVSRELSVPVSPQGPYLAGSLLPDSSPAKACRSSLAWDVNMKRRMGLAFR